MSEDVPPYGAKAHDDNQARIDEMRTRIERLGWSQREAARQLDTNEREFRYWMSGQVDVPAMAIYAMRYLTGEALREPAAVADATGRDPAKRRE